MCYFSLICPATFLEVQYSVGIILFVLNAPFSTWPDTRGGCRPRARSRLAARSERKTIARRVHVCFDANIRMDERQENLDPLHPRAQPIRNAGFNLVGSCNT